MVTTPLYKEYAPSLAKWNRRKWREAVMCLLGEVVTKKSVGFIALHPRSVGKSLLFLGVKIVLDYPQAEARLYRHGKLQLTAHPFED